MRLFSPSKKDKKAKEKKKDSVDTPGKGKQNAPRPPRPHLPFRSLQLPRTCLRSLGRNHPLGQICRLGVMAAKRNKQQQQQQRRRRQRHRSKLWENRTRTCRGPRAAVLPTALGGAYAYSSRAPGERKGSRVFLAWAIDAAKELASAEGRGEKIPFALDVSCCRIKSLVKRPRAGEGVPRRAGRRFKCGSPVGPRHRREGGRAAPGRRG